MSVFRVKKEKDYVAIQKNVLKDKDLTWKAKGIHTYMMSMPDDWTFHIEEIATHAKDGVDSLRAGLKELKNKHYLQRYPVKENGKIVCWETHVFETPQIPEPEKPQVEIPHVENPEVEKPQMESPHEENPTLLKNDLELSIELTKKDRLIDSYNGQGNSNDSQPKEPQSDGMPLSVPGAVQEEISLPDMLGRIEELFVSLCGKYMGDKDYQAAVFLIKSGIPLQTILDGMNQVAKNKKKSDPQSWNDIKSLAYFKKPIQQLHSERMAKEQAIKELAAMVPDLRGTQPEVAATAESTTQASDPNVDAELEALLAKMKGDKA